MTDILIIVDVQDDFIAGSMAVPGAIFAVANINEQMNEKEYDHIFATKDWHPKTHSSFLAKGGPWPAHCVAGETGAAFYGVNSGKIDAVFHKGMKPGVESYSAIYDENGDFASPLIYNLDGLNIDADDGMTIDVVGIATDYCVYFTAFDIEERYGCEVNVLTECCAYVDKDTMTGRMEILKSKGVNVI